MTPPIGRFLLQEPIPGWPLTWERLTPWLGWGCQDGNISLTVEQFWQDLSVVQGRQANGPLFHYWSCTCPHVRMCCLHLYHVIAFSLLKGTMASGAKVQGRQYRPWGYEWAISNSGLQGLLWDLQGKSSSSSKAQGRSFELLFAWTWSTYPITHIVLQPTLSPTTTAT